MDTSVLKFVGAVAALLAVLVVPGLCMRWLEITSAEYASYDDARKAIEAGWIPEWLPRTATNIRETHDIDTNDGFLTFDFSPAESFWGDCVTGSLTRGFPGPNNASRFPTFARRSLEILHQRTDEFDFYECVDRKIHRSVAVDASDGIAIVWLEGSTVYPDVSP